jgi:hypothetical protein
MHGDVSTRPERLPDDGDFLLSVYASTRPELTGLGWPENQQDAFIRMQFDAQTQISGDGCASGVKCRVAG